MLRVAAQRSAQPQPSLRFPAEDRFYFKHEVVAEAAKKAEKKSKVQPSLRLTTLILGKVFPSRHQDRKPQPQLIRAEVEHGTTHVGRSSWRRVRQDAALAISAQQLGLTEETKAAFTSEPALSHHWARWFDMRKLANKEVHFERTVETDRQRTELGQLVADHLDRWKLTKGQVKHASGINSSRRDTQRWQALIKPHLKHLAAASSAGTSLVANLKHVTVTLATWDAVWEVYLDPEWPRQRLRLYAAQDRALQQFYKMMRLERDMAEVSMERHGRAKQLVVFFVAAGIGTKGVWGADAAGPPQAPTSPMQPGSHTASEPGPSSPRPAKRSKRTKAEQAAEPTQPTKGKGKAKSKAAKADKACAFVTDTPSTNKAAWRLVEQRHPRVLSVGCWMHILDLYLHGKANPLALVVALLSCLSSCHVYHVYHAYHVYHVYVLAIEMHYDQQAGGAAVGNQDPAALVAHGQLPSLHACLVAAKQPTTPSQFADPALFSVQPHPASTPVAIALSWLKRQQELQQEKHCQAWLAGSRELLAEAIPLFKVRWRYGDSQVLYLAAILDPRYNMLHFQFSPAQFSQAEQVLSRLVTVDGSQADQPVAMALEQLRRGWGAPPSELLSRTQLMPVHFAPHLTAHPLKWKRSGFCASVFAAAFIYFNKRVLERRPKPQPEAEWQQFAQWMQHMPAEA
ncbi:hypothetical protein QJQ45_025078 [Haematococcus lacustris]|nr:hypothetical protein QJQ45_025078 [Haematococcus lacustris]